MKIGQEVYCIKGTVNLTTGERLIEGKIYVIKNFCNCGCASLVDVGFSSEIGTLCINCNTHLKGNIWWLYSNRFVPIDEIDISDALKVVEILEEEIK